MPDKAQSPLSSQERGRGRGLAVALAQSPLSSQERGRGRGLAVALAILLTLLPTTVSAAGFAVGEQGTASLGVAGAATARVDNPEAGFYNPAAWALQGGVNSALGVALVSPHINHTDPESGESTSAESGLETPPYMHAGFGIPSLGLGFGIHGGVPFGAGLQWPEDWRGRFDVTSIALRAFEVGADIGYSHNFGAVDVAAAAGPRYIASTVALSRRVDAVESEGSVALSGEAQALGFETAALVRIIALSLGVHYRSRATLDFDGQAHFEDIPPELSGAAHDQPVTTSVTLPDRLAFGAAWDANFGVVSADVEVFFWGTFEEFAINFEDEETPDVVEPRNWHTTTAFRVGYEHHGPIPGLRLRGGFAYDPSPSPTDTLSPTLPDSDRVQLTLGAGWRFPFGLGIDAAYAHVFLSETTATGEEVFPGTYGGSADVFSFGLTFETPEESVGPPPPRPPPRPSAPQADSPTGAPR